MLEVWGALAIFIVCPLLGGLPLVAWITRVVAGRDLAQLGTGNISVSAAFYHGGKLAGILAVLSEAGKGIAGVLIARYFFGYGTAWEIIALIALVMGRYWLGKGAGTTNVFWGYLVHDPLVTGLVFLIGALSFTILRERQFGKIGVLILFPVIEALLHPQDSGRILAAIALGGLMGWIYQKIPDDLDLPVQDGEKNSQVVFKFFRGDKSIISLADELDVAKVGQKAATLSQLYRWGYPVPMGWVLPPGDDVQTLSDFLQPSSSSPLVVRSSAIGEDSEQASAAGQYETILNVNSGQGLKEAIARTQASYDTPSAIQYRHDRNAPENAMAVLIQRQVEGVFSGVAFSRDPITQQSDVVVIEAMPGLASQVVSGQVTPEQYQIIVPPVEATSSWKLTDHVELQVLGEGDVPQRLIKQVAYLARHLEGRFHGVPQDIEWSYDGQTLWLLQSRPITTLLPIWTRKIAAEVIPGLIRPLTWSINRPLTCGVWGELFTLVLGRRALGLDFSATATLHYSHAYFNASLLGQIFRRTGLPPESLEFLTMGAKFSRSPLLSTLRNLPGLLRLLGRELSLVRDFARDERLLFIPGFSQLAQQGTVSPPMILARIDLILGLLRRATYYSILSPLSAALRSSVFRVKEENIDRSRAPEVASLRALSGLAVKAAIAFPELAHSDADVVFGELSQTVFGQEILQQFAEILARFGYLSEVGTDIAVPTWREEPQVVKDLFVQFIGNAPPIPQKIQRSGLVQARVDLKGRVTEVYSQLLAELRWCFVELEQVWLRSGLLKEVGDIFYLEFAEVQQIVNDGAVIDLVALVAGRLEQIEQHRQLDIPALIYGNSPPPLGDITPDYSHSRLLQGIGASAGIAVGLVLVLRSLQDIGKVDRQTILVVPYTDSGWAPLLARAGGIISQVGGRLSHGAIIAREYGIPAVMDVHNATKSLRDGQRVRIDGSRGIVEIL
jgi:phosphohistidine swiveling domain-containing protein/glycerol-3-phosphate acyltransferase PlsY